MNKDEFWFWGRGWKGERVRAGGGGGGGMRGGR